MEKELVYNFKKLCNNNRNIFEKIIYIGILYIDLELFCLYILIFKKISEIILTIKYINFENIIILFDINISQFYYLIFSNLI